MELKEIIKFLKKNLPALITVSLLFGLVGIGLYYFIPPKYQATGTLYVKRSVERSNGAFFTYEGYYNQQTAIAYANTVMGLLESTDIRSSALEELFIPVNEASLRKLGRQIKVKKAGNQLINLTVNDYSSQRAEGLWQALTSNTIERAKEQNANSDPFLDIALLNQRPVIKETYRNMWLNFGLGSAIGLLGAIIFLSLRTYLKEQK